MSHPLMSLAPQPACEVKVYDAPPLAPDRYFRGIVGKRILDVGCGTGNLGAALQAKGNACYGVTISPMEADLARAKMSQVIVADMETLSGPPFPQNFFDVVIFADVLEHLRNPGHILKLIKPHLTRGAQVIASIPNVANVVVRLNLLRGQFTYESEGILDNTHVRFYTLSSAKTLLTSTGYRVDSVEFTNWNWQLPRLARACTFGYEWELRERMTRRWPGLFATQFVLYASDVVDGRGVQ